MDAAARQANRDPIFRSSHRLAPLPVKKDRVFLQQMYDHLKTLPEFTPAADV